MTVLGGDEGKARVAASLLLTLPGNPFLYYGEELGMKGAKPDENIREPLPWTKDRTAAGNTRWMTPKHNGADAVSAVEATADDESLFHHYRKLIEFRKEDEALRGGALKSLKVGGGLESYLRETENGDASLVIHNVTGGALSVDLADTEETSGFVRLAFATSEDAALDGSIATLPAYGSIVVKK
jgi:glycosidase